MCADDREVIRKTWYHHKYLTVLKKQPFHAKSSNTKFGRIQLIVTTCFNELTYHFILGWRFRDISMQGDVKREISAKTCVCVIKWWNLPKMQYQCSWWHSKQQNSRAYIVVQKNSWFLSVYHSKCATDSNGAAVPGTSCPKPPYSLTQSSPKQTQKVSNKRGGKPCPTTCENRCAAESLPESLAHLAGIEPMP